MKRILASLMAIALLVTSIPIMAADAAAPQKKIYMFVDENQLTFTDVQPYIDSNNRTMVPVRLPSEAFGAKNYWDAVKKQVTIKHESNTIILTIGSQDYTINGKSATMDTAAVIKDGRTMVPFRFISEGLGMQVDYKQMQDGSMAIFAFTKSQTASEQTKLMDGFVANMNGQGLPVTDIEDKTGRILPEVGKQYRDVVYNSIKKTDKGVETFLPEPPAGYEWAMSITVIYDIEYAKEFRRIDPLYPNGSRNGVQEYGKVIWQYGPKYKDSAVEGIVVTYGLEKTATSGLLEWDAVDIITGEFKENTRRR